MKTLIINGSPRTGGDTEALINEFTARLKGEYRLVTWKDNISPCIDCRFCWKNDGCAIQDGMQEIYEYWRACENVALASPIWFSSLSGPALNIASRFQTSFIARFRRKIPSPPTKNGVLMLVGAQPGTEAHPEENALTILRSMNVKRPLVATIRSMNTDSVPARADEAALAACRAAAEQLNRLSRP